jgi:hypothetical protein
MAAMRFRLRWSVSPSSLAGMTPPASQQQQQAPLRVYCRKTLPQSRLFVPRSRIGLLTSLTSKSRVSCMSCGGCNCALSLLTQAFAGLHTYRPAFGNRRDWRHGSNRPQKRGRSALTPAPALQNAHIHHRIHHHLQRNLHKQSTLFQPLLQSYLQQWPTTTLWTPATVPTPARRV